MTPLLRRLGVDFEPHTPVADLSLAQRQLVEIAKALSLDARLVIMDEPTSSLTASETERLLKVIADLKAGGVSVIFISHRLNEVEHCADRVVVLRDGAVVGELARGEIRHDADDPADDRPRPEVALHPGRAAAGRRGARDRGRADRRIPTTRSTSPCAPARSWAWRAWSAPAAPSSPAPSSASTALRRRRRSASTASRSRSARRATRSSAASTWCPRTASAPGWCSTYSVAENISLPDLHGLRRAAC